jgi:hypothetical protein
MACLLPVHAIQSHHFCRIISHFQKIIARLPFQNILHRNCIDVSDVFFINSNIGIGASPAPPLLIGWLGFLASYYSEFKLMFHLFNLPF